jgi:hypothetical protein
MHRIYGCLTRTHLSLTLPIVFGGRHLYLHGAFRSILPDSIHTSVHNIHTPGLLRSRLRTTWHPSYRPTDDILILFTYFVTIIRVSDLSVVCTMRAQWRSIPLRRWSSTTMGFLSSPTTTVCFCFEIHFLCLGTWVGSSFCSCFYRIVNSVPRVIRHEVYIVN